MLRLAAVTATPGADAPPIHGASMDLFAAVGATGVEIPSRNRGERNPATASF
jgi:hypothetical protein